MRSTIRLGAAFLALAFTAGCGSNERSKLIGAWELTAIDGHASAPHWRFEFMKDGTCRFVAKRGDREKHVQGTYTIKASTLTCTVEQNGRTDIQTLTIHKLTDDVLIYSFGEQKLEFKRAQ